MRAAEKNSLVAEEPVSEPGVGWIAPGEAAQPLTLNHPALNPGRPQAAGVLSFKAASRARGPRLFGTRLDSVRRNRGFLFGPNDQIVAMNHLRAAAEAEN